MKIKQETHFSELLMYLVKTWQPVTFVNGGLEHYLMAKFKIKILFKITFVTKVVFWINSLWLISFYSHEKTLKSVITFSPIVDLLSLDCYSENKFACDLSYSIRTNSGLVRWVTGVTSFDVGGQVWQQPINSERRSTYHKNVYVLYFFSNCSLASPNKKIKDGNTIFTDKEFWFC